MAICAAFSHGLQAAGYEERRQKYQRRLKGASREQVNAALLNVNGSSSWLARIYDKGQKIVSGGESLLEPVIEAYRSSESPENPATELVKTTSKIVRAWALLNANNRTVMIAVIALFARPEFYFIYEVIVLNIVLVGLIIYERVSERRIAAIAMSELSGP